MLDFSHVRSGARSGMPQIKQMGTLPVINNDFIRTVFLRQGVVYSGTQKRESGTDPAFPFYALHLKKQLLHHDFHTHYGPDELNGNAGDDHQDNTGRDSVPKKFTRGELFGIIGNGIGSRTDQEQEGHARHH